MNDITLLEYWNLLKQRKHTVFATIIVALLVAIIYLIVTPRVYKSDVTILFPSQGSQGIGIQLAQATGLQIPGGIGTFSSRDIYTSVLKSRTLSESVMRILNLNRYGIKYDDLRNTLIVNVTKEGGLSVGCQVPTSWLSGRVPNRELQAKTAELSAELANAYIRELRDYDRSSALFMGKKNRLYVERQLDLTKQELACAEQRLQRFQIDHPALVPPEKNSLYTEQIVDIAAKGVEAEIDLREAERRVSSVRSIWNSGAPKGVSSKALIQSSTIDSLRGHLAGLEVNRATLLEDLTENHPDVVAVTQEIAKMRDRISVEVSRVIQGESSSVDPARQEILKELVIAEVTRDSLSARRDAFAKTLTQLERRASGLPPTQMEYVRLLRDLKSTETVYTTLLSEAAKARITEDRDTDSFIVLDYAAIPTDPANPRVKITLLSTLMAGTMLGILLASAQGPRLPRKLLV